MKELSEIKEQIEKRLRESVYKGKKENLWDGRQTPLEGKLIYYAQHATASCCRKCIEEWHGINRNVSLSNEQIIYLVELIMIYMKNRLESPEAESNIIKKE